MSYKHLLVAVDLYQSSEEVINKAVSLAKDSNAKLSFIYVDSNYVTNYMGLSHAGGVSNATLGVVVPKLLPVDDQIDALQEKLHALAAQSDYPIANTLVVIGDLNDKLKLAVKELDVDLLICGHHSDFWSSLLSSVRKLINSITIDLLIIQL